MNKGSTNFSKTEYLLKVYDQQHYFVDRHDNMAEKFMNVLLIEVTSISVLMALISDSITISIKTIWPLVIFIIMFSISLIELFLTVRPLSSKAKKRKKKTFVDSKNKTGILDSSIYYRGIVDQGIKARRNKQSQYKMYLKTIYSSRIQKDLIRQIFILAQYSDYKRKQLEKSIKMVVGTTVIGIFSTIWIILQ